MEEKVRDFLRAYAKRPYKTEAARKSAITRDLRETRNVVRANHPTSYEAWKREPWLYDLAGVDTKGSERSTRNWMDRILMESLIKDPAVVEEVQDMSMAFSVLQSDLEASRQKTREAEKEIDALLTELRKEKLTYLVALEKREEELAKCLTEKEARKQKTLRLEGNPKVLEETIRKLNQQIAQLLDQIQECEARSSECDVARDQCQQDKKTLEEEIRRVTESANRQAQEFLKQNAQKEATENLSGLEDRALRLQKKREATRERLQKESEATRERLQKEREATRERLQELQEALEKDDEAQEKRRLERAKRQEEFKKRLEEEERAFEERREARSKQPLQKKRQEEEEFEERREARSKQREQRSARLQKLLNK